MSGVEPLSSPNSQHDLGAVCSDGPSPCVTRIIHRITEMKKLMESWCQQSGKDETNRDGVHHSETLSLEQKVNGVLGEALHLTERLEADRQNAEKALLQEKEKSRFLKNKFASISSWRQKENSSVVQKEHEACRKDIKQFRSQLRLERKKFNQIQEKLSRATVLNQHLQEDLSFVQKQILIVTEDLDHQNDLIDQLKTTQAEADDVCSETRSNLLQAQEKLKAAQVDKEKLLMECELLPMRKRTEERLEELKQLKTAERDLISEIKDTEENVDLIQKTCALLSQKIPQLEEREKREKDKVSQLQLQIKDKILKNRKLSSVKEDVEKTKLKGQAEVSSIEEQLQSKHEALERLLKENIDYEQKIEDCKIKICQSEKTLTQIHEETKDVVLDIGDTEEQQKKAAKQLMQVAAQHRNSQNELKEKKQLILLQERRAKAEIEDLNRELSDLVTAEESYKVELERVNTELKEKQISSGQIDQDLQKEFEDAALKVKDLEANVKEIWQMTEKLEEIQSDHKKMLVELKQQKQLKCDQLNAALDLCESTTMRCDIILGRITDLMNECEDYHNAADQMEKNVEHMQEEIGELQMDLNVVEFKHKSAAHIMRILRSDIKACQERTQRSVQTHTTLVKARRKQMQDTKEALQDALVENQLLADKYKRLQKTLVEAEQDAVSALSEQNRSHQTLNYYSQEKLSEEIQLISEFLESVRDDSATVNDAG